MESRTIVSGFAMKTSPKARTLSSLSQRNRTRASALKRARCHLRLRRSCKAACCAEQSQQALRAAEGLQHAFLGSRRQGKALQSRTLLERLCNHVEQFFENAKVLPLYCRADRLLHQVIA